MLIKNTHISHASDWTLTQVDIEKRQLPFPAYTFPGTLSFHVECWYLHGMFFCWPSSCKFCCQILFFVTLVVLDSQSRVRNLPVLKSMQHFGFGLELNMACSSCKHSLIFLIWARIIWMLFASTWFWPSCGILWHIRGNIEWSYFWCDRPYLSQWSPGHQA